MTNPQRHRHDGGYWWFALLLLAVLATSVALRAPDKRATIAAVATAGAPAEAVTSPR